MLAWCQRAQPKSIHNQFLNVSGFIFGMSCSVLYSQNLILIVDFFISRLFLLITYKQTNKCSIPIMVFWICNRKKVMPTFRERTKKLAFNFWILSSDSHRYCMVLNKKNIRGTWLFVDGKFINQRTKLWTCDVLNNERDTGMNKLHKTVFKLIESSYLYVSSM